MFNIMQTMQNLNLVKKTKEDLGINSENYFK